MNFGLELITKGKSITQTDLQRLAVVIRSEIPIELQNLLLLHNGGDLEVNSFYRLIGNATFQTSNVESIMSMEEIETTFNNLSDDSIFCESKIIPFASLLGSGIAGIGRNVYNRGKIYMYDWEYGLTYQATSLNEFCNN